MSNGLEENLSRGQALEQNRNEERRASPRMRAFKEGKIAYHDEFCTANCIIKDISESGVKVVLENMPLSMDDMVLHIPLDGVKVTVRKAWSNGKVWGLSFTGSKEHSPIARRQVVKDSAQEVKTWHLPAPSARVEPEDDEPAPAHRSFGKRV